MSDIVGLYGHKSRKVLLVKGGFAYYEATLLLEGEHGPLEVPGWGKQELDFDKPTGAIEWRLEKFEELQ